MNIKSKKPFDGAEIFDCGKLGLDIVDAVDCVGKREEIVNVYGDDSDIGALSFLNENSFICRYQEDKLILDVVRPEKFGLL